MKQLGYRAFIAGLCFHSYQQVRLPVPPPLPLPAGQTPLQLPAGQTRSAPSPIHTATSRSDSQDPHSCCYKQVGFLVPSLRAGGSVAYGKSIAPRAMFLPLGQEGCC